MSGTAEIVHGNALDLPIPDATVDLIVTSPPYFGLRSYQDGGEHYEGQIGDEATPAEFVDALIAATREMVRVLKPSGSIFVNLGDKYATAGTFRGNEQGLVDVDTRTATHYMPRPPGIPTKSLIGVPWRYALRCIDDLGLILRAEIVWAKPNGLPESVTDRVRRSHEQWFHFTVSPRYYSAVDEIREDHIGGYSGLAATFKRNHAPRPGTPGAPDQHRADRADVDAAHPLGKLPGSVWEIPTQPLRVPAHLGIDHFAAFPMEFPRRIIRGWSPSGVCVECGEGRRPVSGTRCHECGELRPNQAKRCPGCGHVRDWKSGRVMSGDMGATDWSTAGHGTPRHPGGHKSTSEPGGYACACPTPTAPTTPAVVLDPFGGTGTTALVAKALGRRGISVDLSRDYCRLAEWRTNDPGELARAMQVEKPPAVDDQQGDLLEMLA